MNTKILREFQIVYERRSIHKAAKELFITPQGLGKNIRQLESELKTELFERTKQGMVPTASARLLYQRSGEIIRQLAERLTALRNLEEKREMVRNAITEQGAMTDELSAKLEAAMTQTEIEDIYRPYRPKRRTRASIAKEKGLAPLAEYIFGQAFLVPLEEYAAAFVDAEKGVESVEDAINGAKDILADAFLGKKKVPQTYLEALKELVVVEEEKERLQLELDRSKDWYSIKRVAALNGVSWKTFDWRRLKRVGSQMGYEVRKIFDANYGEVNLYHKDVWEAAYPRYEI